MNKKKCVRCGKPTSKKQRHGEQVRFLLFFRRWRYTTRYFCIYCPRLRFVTVNTAEGVLNVMKSEEGQKIIERIIKRK